MQCLTSLNYALNVKASSCLIPRSKSRVIKRASSKFPATPHLTWALLRFCISCIGYALSSEFKIA